MLSILQEQKVLIKSGDFFEFTVFAQGSKKNKSRHEVHHACYIRKTLPLILIFFWRFFSLFCRKFKVGGRKFFLVSRRNDLFDFFSLIHEGQRVCGQLWLFYLFCFFFLCHYYR